MKSLNVKIGQEFLCPNENVNSPRETKSFILFGDRERTPQNPRNPQNTKNNDIAISTTRGGIYYYKM